MLEEMRLVVSEIAKLDEAQRGPYTTWLIVTMVRDVSWCILAGILAWGIGRRLIEAAVHGMREGRRVRD